MNDVSVYIFAKVRGLNRLDNTYLWWFYMLEIRERQTSPEVAALPGFVSAMCLYKHELSSRKKLFQKDIIQRIVTIFATETPRNINRMAKIKFQNTEITIINHDDK